MLYWLQWIIKIFDSNNFNLYNNNNNSNNNNNNNNFLPKLNFLIDILLC